MTAICFYGTPSYRKYVSSLPLALKNHGNVESRNTEETYGV